MTKSEEKTSEERTSERKTSEGTTSERTTSAGTPAESTKPDKRRKASRLPDDVDQAIRAAEDKKAEDLVLLDLQKAGGFTDYFVICSGGNPRQIRAIADGIVETLAANGTRPSHVEGYDRSEWILIDYFDFIVHVFGRETRFFYSLERLWGNAERIDRP